MIDLRTHRIPIMMTDAELGAIDAWRFANRVPTRSKAIRQLIERALSLSFEEKENNAS